MKLEILYEDQEILVCMKPAGIPTQTKRIGAPDMVSLLKNYLHDSHPESGSPYLAVIHRLDQPVEGLLVFARTPAAAKSLNRQLTASGFGKYYLAILSSVPSRKESTLEDYMIKDSRTNTSRICSPDTPGSKSARLHYKVLRTQNGLALTEIHLDTGRHHQIRVQTAHLGCPVVGDIKYGSPLSSRQLCLYAAQLSFCHPKTGRALSFSYTPKLPF